MDPRDLVEEEVCDSSSAGKASVSQRERAFSASAPTLGGTWPPQLPVVPCSLHYSYSSTALAHAEEEAAEPGTPQHQLSPVVQVSGVAHAVVRVYGSGRLQYVRRPATQVGLW